METSQIQDGGMLVTPDASTPSSSSPVDIVSQILNDDDDYFLGNDKSRTSSDDDCEDFHLPLFKRGAKKGTLSGFQPLASKACNGDNVCNDIGHYYEGRNRDFASNFTSNSDLGSSSSDLSMLHQAVSLAALTLNDPPPPVALPFGSQQALANIAALARIEELQQSPHQQNSFSRQLSLQPSLQLTPKPSLMSPKGANYWKHDPRGTYQKNNFGWRPPLRSSLSFPASTVPAYELGDIMQIRLKFGFLGDGPGQFNEPIGFCMGRNEEIVVADTKNHRIQVFDKHGCFRFKFGRPGTDEGALWFPRKVTVLRHNGCFVVCDRGAERSRMQLFDEHGVFLRRIPIGTIAIVSGMTTTMDGNVAIVDSVCRAIFIINPESGQALYTVDVSQFMTEPSDIAFFKNDFYLCDYKDHSVVVVSASGILRRKIPTDKISLYPNGIDISDAGDILVGDSHGNQFHVAIFDCKGQFVSHFHCPQVKVSRCSGLKITPEGYIVTLAKSNNQILMLNTLCVP